MQNIYEEIEKIQNIFSHNLISSEDISWMDGSPLLWGVSETNVNIIATPRKPPNADAMNPYSQPNAATIEPVITIDNASPI